MAKGDMNHPVIESKPCHVCKSPATESYKCADCGKYCCNNHMYWCSKTDGKWRCSKHFEEHNTKQKVSYVGGNKGSK